MPTSRNLDHIVFTKIPAAEGDAEHLNVVAASAGLSRDDAAIWRGLVIIDPPNEEDAAVGIFKGPEQAHDRILVRVHSKNNERLLPVYHCVFLPYTILSEMTTDIARLVDLTGNLPEMINGDESVLPLHLAPLVTEDDSDDSDDLVHILEDLQALDAQLSVPLLLQMLDAALDGRRLLIRGFSPDINTRLQLVQALMLLLPAQVRAEMTFVSNVNSLQKMRGKVVFSEEIDETTRYVLDMESGSFVDDELPQAPYVHCLQMLWQDDIIAFAEELQKIDKVAGQFSIGTDLEEGLMAVAERYMLNVDILAGNEVAIGKVIDVLSGENPPPQGELRQAYAKLMLEHTLQERIPEYAELLVQYMEEDSDLNRELREQLAQALQTEPDAVYFFARTHLAQEINPDWLPLLQEAAIAALHVAIEGGDNEILIEWLRLVAREPADYQLADVLNDCIQAAQQRAHEDGDLGARLLAFTCKRAPDMIRMLLEDGEMLEMMQAPSGPALRDYEQEAVETTISLGHEIALVVMGSAARDAGNNPAAAAVFTAAHVEYLWSLAYSDEPLGNLPGYFQPAYIINVLVSEGVTWLETSALQVLLAYIVNSERLDLFQQMAARLAARDLLFPMLIDVFEANNLSAGVVINLIRQAGDDDVLSAQQRIDAYLRLIEYRKWHYEDVHLMVEQVAHLLQQNKDTKIMTETLWQMLNVAGEGSIDLVGRVVARRIVVYVETVEDEIRLVEIMQRLHDQLRWSASALTFYFDWWRDFVRKQPLVRLQQVNKLLEDKRNLREARSIVQTGISIKRTLGIHSLEEFAGMVNSTYALLLVFSDSFDPVNRHDRQFDQATVRAEFDAREAELPPHERRALANNLRELAQLITTMADNRSKATIMRREEDVERQLVTGEQDPHSAIDTMKWLSGYLDGKSEE